MISFLWVIFPCCRLSRKKGRRRREEGKKRKRRREGKRRKGFGMF